MEKKLHNSSWVQQFGLSFLTYVDFKLQKKNKDCERILFFVNISFFTTSIKMGITRYTQSYLPFKMVPKKKTKECLIFWLS